MVGTAETTWEWKKTNTEDSETSTQGPEHRPLLPNQYKKGGPAVKGLRGCDLEVGGKEFILGF